MTNEIDGHDFDWVTARAQCSLANEFVRLKEQVGRDVCARRKCLPKDNSMDFSFHATGDEHFSVSRFPIPGIAGNSYSVIFSLRNDQILIVDEWSEPAKRLILTLTLNDEGECRFLINGEGDRLRWQVVRRALCPIFFQWPGERGGK